MNTQPSRSGLARFTICDTLVAKKNYAVMTFQRRIRQLHKILTFAVFAQLLLWMLSGLYMTAVPIDIVRGNHLVEHAKPKMLATDRVVPVSSLATRYSEIQSVHLFSVLHTPVYKVITSEGPSLLNALTGEPMPPISQTEAESVAQAAYTGDAPLADTSLLTEPEQAPEAGGRPFPLWQIAFDDVFHTTFYVSASEANIVAVRSDIWRVFDFLWMLHIMDYDERSDFNNPLVILMSSIGLLAIVSGLLLIANGMKKGGIKSIVK
ncbi:hypothetical protein DRW07_10375 [Alteromonas sediminis]|uniref:PepSY domain-containing protein n=1 Tax=Alteromonas sediminis TaxID=2259342 RepID=A0A3N5YMC2_9ALTE|nr:hypothetical protein [Alteromonas sediminis]RPJ66491.1 hypothetical protein DRW07_10375 [Alteromonas sediminis]